MSAIIEHPIPVKMYLPKTLQIGPYTIYVVRDDLSWAEDRDETIAGLWKHEEYTIYLSRNLLDVELLDTFLHELAHACSDLYGAELSEGQAQCLGTAMAQALNPYLRLLTEDQA